MLILGIDPGTAVTGFGVVRANPGGVNELVECGVIRTKPDLPLAERLKDIADGVRELLARHRPDAMAVEDAFYARNVRTTLVLGHARGVILLAGAEAGIPIHEYAPAEIKKAVVGAGAATKGQVQFMLAKLLRLKSAPQPADAADGVAAALTCAMRLPFTRSVAGARAALKVRR
ncbi:MAG: crossover junction endodeoxyribonuclease RuvC [Gemmatimonadaceae bacterium]